MCIKGRLTKMQYCGKCGRELDKNTGLCSKCDKSGDSKTNKNGRKKLILIVVAVVLVLTIIITCCVSCGKSNSTVTPASVANSKIEMKPIDYENVIFKDGKLFVESELLITANDAYTYSDIENTVAEYGGKIVGCIEFTNDYQIEFADMDYLTLFETQEILQGSLEDCEVTLHRVFYENDSDKSPVSEFEKEDKDGNWWRDEIRITELEADDNSYEKVRVGIFDTLFDTDNPDLEYAFNENNVWYNQEDEADMGAHGTNVAGFLAAKKDNEYGIDGVANNVEFYAYAYRGSVHGFHPSSLMEEKYWNAKMLAQGTKIINMSAGNNEMLVGAQSGDTTAYATLKECSDGMGAFYRKYIDAGSEFVVVKSAGNQNGYEWIRCDPSKEHPYGVKMYDKEKDGDITRYTKIDEDLFDAKYDILGAITDNKVMNRIIIVGSSNRLRQRSYHSVSGSRVDIYAPGDRLRELTSDNPGYGTSYAAPIVSGTISLMLGINPNIEADKIKYLLLSSATQPIEEENYQVAYDSDSNTKMFKCIVDTKNAVDRAKNHTVKEQINETTDNDNTYLMGLTTIYEDGKFEYNKKGCIVTIYKNDVDETLYKELETDEFGEFETKIEQGNYIIVSKTKDGTYQSDRLLFSVNKNEVKYLCSLPMYNTSASLSNTNFKHDNYLVEIDNIVYYVDDFGLWKNGGTAEGECLHECTATNIASNGEVVYYSVYNKEKSAYCEEYGQDAKWKQYDLYCYDLRTLSNRKITSFIECGKPIGVYNNKLYYTDYPDDFTGYVVGKSHNLYSYDLNTGEKEYISEGAYQLEMYGTSIYYRDLDAAMGDSELYCYDMANGNVKQVTSKEIMNFFISGDSLFYYTNQYNSELGSDKEYHTKVDCEVFKYNLLDGSVENVLKLKENADVVAIQYVDENYLYYYIGGAGYTNYRMNLSTKEKNCIKYKARDSGSFRMSDESIYSVLKFDNYALYYSGWDTVYFYQVNDNDSSAVPFNAYYKGYRFLNVCGDGVYMLKQTDEGFTYVIRYYFNREAESLVGYGA